MATDRYGEAKEYVHRVADEARKEVKEFQDRAKDVYNTAKYAVQTASGVTAGKALRKVVSGR